jgi:RHS repeat-associated protein
MFCSYDAENRLTSCDRYEDVDTMPEHVGSEYHYYYDAQGSVTGLSSQAGNRVAQYEYTAFGEKRESGVIADAYRFSSKEWEQDSGLVYFGARYYDPQAGRWLTPDPAGMADGPNVYLYVNNNPVNLVDPWGLMGERINYWREAAYWLGDNAGSLAELGAGGALHVLGSTADLGTVTLGFISVPSGGGSLTLVPVTVSVSAVAHTSGTALMVHAMYSMSNHPNNDKIFKEARKSLLRETKLLKKVDEPAPDIMPKSKLAKFLSDLADLLDELM